MESQNGSAMSVLGKVNGYMSRPLNPLNLKTLSTPPRPASTVTGSFISNIVSATSYLCYPCQKPELGLRDNRRLHEESMEFRAGLGALFCLAA